MTSNDSTPARAEASGGGDPWQAVEYALTPLLQAIDGPVVQSIRCRIDEARAAVEAQHRQEIERVREAMRHELAHDFGKLRQEIEQERQAHERTLTEWSALADNLSACSDARSRVEAEQDKYRNGFESSQEQIGLLLAERDALRSELDECRRAYSATCAERDAYDDRLDALTAQIAALREALARADEGIVRGQACRSESEFVRWMHEVQALRPSATLLAATEGGTK